MFGADADVGVFIQEQAELRREVEVGLVVRRGREQDGEAFVAFDVFADDLPSLAVLVAQVVRFVDQYQPVAPGFLWQLIDDPRQRQHLGVQAVAVDVVLPHWHQVLGADDEGFGVIVVFEDLGQRRGHHRLAQAHHVADQHATALVEVVRGDLDGGGLEVEQRAVEDRGNAEFREPGPRFLREVVGHLQIDVIGR